MDVTVSLAKQRADSENYKAHAEYGQYFLTSTSAAPTDNYYGFSVTGSGTTISSITYNNSALIGGDITQLTLVQGMYYPISGGFSTITLSAGDMVLYKRGE